MRTTALVLARYRVQSLLAACLTTMLAACGHARLFERPNTVEFADEAGAVEFAVLSIGDWNDYVESLRPGFAITAQTALDQSVESTRTLEESVLNALRVAAQVNLEKTTVSSSRTSTVNADGSSETSSTTSTEGPLAEAAPSAPTANALPSQLRATLPTAGNTSVDASLRYAAATALYQEVQLLNRYVLDAATREDTIPYLVRLQITVMPTARRLPYDTYANISFFTSDGKGADLATWGGAASSCTVGSESKDRAANVDAVVRQYKHLLESERSSLIEQVESGMPAEPYVDTLERLVGREPIVVPLLVTDNIESTARARMVDDLRQYALALSALRANTGIGASFERVAENLQRIGGRDMNSLLTVGRLLENTIHVRLGAMQAVEADYTMMPRTHNVTLLLLVPAAMGAPAGNCPQLAQKAIRVALRSEFRDYRTGRALESRGPTVVRQSLRKINNEFEELDMCKLNDLDLRRVYNVVESGDVNLMERMYADASACSTFKKPSAVDDDPCGPRKTEEFLRNYGLRLWTRLAAVQASNGTKLSWINPPKPRYPSLPTGVTSAFDDGKTLTLSLLNGAKLSDRSLAASFETTVGASSIVLSATRQSVDESRRRIDLTFPSLRKWTGEKSPAVTGTKVTARCTAGCCIGRDIDTLSVANLLTAGAPAAKTPGFSLSVGATAIWADITRKGAFVADIKFAEKAPAKYVTLNVSGADIESVTCVPANCVAGDGEWRITKSGHVTVRLANLTSRLKVAAVDDNDAGPDAIEIDVLTQQTVESASSKRP